MSDDDQQYDIEVSNAHPAAWVDHDLLQEAARATLRRFEVRRAHLSLAIVDDTRIAELHERFCDIPGATDVLTFDLADTAVNEAGIQLDGEIVASAETAARAARQRGHPASAELALYVVHGVLHLLGHDDKDPDQARTMHALEDDILCSCGIGPVYGGK